MKLASAQIITAIDSIPGADNIVKATLLGWEIVVKKDEFIEGDLVAYIQIDTIVPSIPEFEFLRDRNFRVRTIKLRKQISQGLIVPLPPGMWREGDDLTDILGIQKYSKDKEREAISQMPKKPKSKLGYLKWLFKKHILYFLFPHLNKYRSAAFPKHLVSITDEERIQNIPHVLTQFAGKEFVISEKLDGSSITIIHERKFGKSKYRICSRRLELFDSNNVWHKAFNITNFSIHINTLVRHFKTNNVIVQGELIGSPQGNKYKLLQDEIRLFNIFINGIKLPQDEFYSVCNDFKIPCCPLITTTTIHTDLSSLLEYAEDKSQLNKNTEREGIVCRCIDPKMPPLSFKVISNKFLLKNDE